MNVKKMLLGITVSMFALAGAAQAEEAFPQKALSLVVVWPAGGGHDVAARLLGEYAGRVLGQPIVVNNVTGASGSNGMRAIAKAKPDGYTIGLMGMHALAQSYMNPKAPSLNMFEPLVYMATEPGALQVRSQLGIETVQEYVDYLQNDPGAIVHGNDAMGGNTFVYTGMLEKKFGIELTKVPYIGHAPNIAALVSGEVSSAALPVSGIAQHHRSGTIKVLGVMSEERSHLLPDVPTFKEQGYDLIAADYYMVVMPKGVPDAVAEKLEKGMLEAMNDPQFQESARTMGLVIEPADREEAKAILAEQVETIYPILLDGGLVHSSLKR